MLTHTVLVSGTTVTAMLAGPSSGGPIMIWGLDLGSFLLMATFLVPSFFLIGVFVVAAVAEAFRGGQ